MKRRNDVEKTMEPMYPRLHVNDKTKGGPRAPPRNKMALYEQLTIPSQRFNPRGLPQNTLPTSSIQESGVVRDSSNLSLTNDHPDDKSHYHDEKQGDEDDCSVPIYVQSRMSRDSKRGEKPTSAGSKSSSNVALDGRDYGDRHNCALDSNSKEDVMSPSEDKSKDQELEDDVCVKGNLRQEDKIVKTDGCEILMVDSMSRSDVSPDDVVGVMGQRRFWKARETIARHQRVFAFQLFELHRLIKVQQLIAGSPQLCAEDSFFIANSTVMVSPTKKHQSKCIGKSLSKASKKLIDRKQRSSDNAMSNTSIPLAQNLEHFGTAHPMPLASERNMTNWCFPQPIANRWLIPVMSPSEGLVYKPCPEGYIPYGSMPMMSGFANPTQENDVFSIKSPTEHHYTHPQSIRPMNRAISDSVGDQSSSCGQGSNCQQSFVPTQKSSFVPSNGSRGTELQARSRSHCSERDQSTGSDHGTGERDGTHLPVDEVVTHTNVQTHGGNIPSQVIKVVPRNPQSASESAARIFQSIQEERKLRPRD